MEADRARRCDTYRPGAASWSAVSVAGSQPSPREAPDFLYDRGFEPIPAPRRSAIRTSGASGYPSIRRRGNSTFLAPAVANGFSRARVGPGYGFDDPAAISDEPMNDTMFAIGGSGNLASDPTSGWWLSHTSTLNVVVEAVAPPSFVSLAMAVAVSVPGAAGVTNYLGVVALSHEPAGLLNVSATAGITGAPP